MKQRLLFITALAVAGMVGLATADVLAAHHTKTAKVRVLHASPDAPRVDVLVNNEVTLEDVPFSALSGYLEVPAGQYNLKVRPANAMSPTVINADVDLVAGAKYTVIARNTLADIKPSVVTKNVQPAHGMTNIRVSHWSTDAPAVNITSLDGNVLIGDLSYGESADLTIPAGVYSLQVRLASDNSQVVTDLANLDLRAGTNYTAYALGTVAAGDAADFQVKLVLD